MVFALATPTLSIGDFVTSRAHPDRAGEVVNVAKLDSGYVAVRWRSPSGVLLQAVDEPVDGVALLGREWSAPGATLLPRDVSQCDTSLLLLRGSRMSDPRVSRPKIVLTLQPSESSS